VGESVGCRNAFTEALFILLNINRPVKIIPTSPKITITSTLSKEKSIHNGVGCFGRLALRLFISARVSVGILYLHHRIVPLPARCAGIAPAELREMPVSFPSTGGAIPLPKGFQGGWIHFDATSLRVRFVIAFDLCSYDRH